MFRTGVAGGMKSARLAPLTTGRAALGRLPLLGDAEARQLEVLDGLDGSSVAIVASACALRSIGLAHGTIGILMPCLAARPAGSLFPRDFRVWALGDALAVRLAAIGASAWLPIRRQWTSSAAARDGCNELL